MIRTCPKCGDYYTDSSLAFCLADGTPLVDVSPNGERWGEAVRVVEEKESALKKQKRRLKWRRVLLRAVTMLITAMIVFVVAVNSFIYLKPKQEEVARAEPLRPSASGPNAPVTPSPQVEPTATPAPQPTVRPRPTATPISTPTPTPTPYPTPVCSDADKRRETQVIINRYGDGWRRIIEGERRGIIAGNMQAGVKNAEASLGVIEYPDTLKACTAGSVTARYVWQIRTNVNGTVKVVTVPRQKKFSCVKVRGAWHCN